MNISLWV
jgi:hypothetical protein